MLVIPIGGGGLIAGNAVAARAVEAGDRDRRGRGGALSVVLECACTARTARSAARRWRKASRSKNVGVLALPIVRDLVSEIVLVDEAHLERAVNAYLTLQKTMAEGAGAAGLAAMLVEAGAIPRPQGRAHPMRRQYRSAHSRLGHGARARARGPHRLVPADHSRPARRARADRHPARPARRQHPRGRSPPAVSRRAGQGRQARRHGRRRATRRMGRTFSRRSRRKAISRCWIDTASDAWNSVPDRSRADFRSGLSLSMIAPGWANQR